MTSRLEIRLDAERRRRLTELAESRHVSISDFVRSLLDREYEEWLEAQRVRAAGAIAALLAEDVTEPDVLDQQLGEVYGPPLC
jgi:uncharacterized protein (DUF1778 family)